MKNISTIKLIGLLVVLLLIYAGIEFFGNEGRSRSFREELVSIDTASVTKIRIAKSSKEVILSKEVDEGIREWSVSSTDNPEYEAKTDRIKSMLSNLQSIRPSRIASRNREKWQEFQVDSSGTRVEVYEGNEKTVDIVIGRFGMQGQQQFHSYVRLFDENDVYVADNFMAFSIPVDISSYRNQIITTFNRDSVNSIAFNYPADSSFILRRSISGQWISDNFNPDSTKMAQYLSSLSRLSNSNFENTTNIEGVEPRYSNILEINGSDPIQIDAYVKNDSAFIIKSTLNPEAQFEDSSLFDKIFKPQSSFYSEITEDSE